MTTDFSLFHSCQNQSDYYGGTKQLVSHGVPQQQSVTTSIMEMEKPKATQQGMSTSPALASSAPQLSSVEDLERRLKLIGNAPPADTVIVKPAAAAAPPAATSGMTGKAALLVRFFIMLFRGESTSG